MDELAELRQKIEHQDYQSALQIIDELEEMSKEDKLNKISSYLVILILHLIKEKAENRTSKSWSRSIDNSVYRINKVNKRRKSGGYYASKADLVELIGEAYPQALKEAAYEAFEGEYKAEYLAKMVDEQQIQLTALEYLDC